MCPVCKSLILKTFDELTLDADSDVVDDGKECPYCTSSEGMKILGQVAEVSKDNGEEKDEVEVEETEEVLDEGVSPRSRDDIDAIADDKKETAKKVLARKKDDADSDRDYQLKKNGLTESTNLQKFMKGIKKYIPDYKVEEELTESAITDKVVIKLSEDGFLTKMHDLRAKGYKTIGTGDGEVIMGLYADDTVKEGCENGLCEEPIYGLNTQFDKRKSFGGKAQVDVSNGEETLYSYDTPVVRIKDETVTLLPKWDFSPTTLRHVKEFLKQHGFKAETRNQIAADYPQDMEESLTEDFKDVTITTDDTHMEMTSDESGKVTVTTEPVHKDEEETFGEDTEEVIVPLSDKDAQDLRVKKLGEPEENEEETVDVDFDEFNEEEFDNLGESYLKEVYENVKSYKTTSGKMDGNKLIFEGVIGFNSGKQAKTKFVFEGYTTTKRGKIKFLGENANITKNKKAFTLTGKVDGKKLITESLTYNYRGFDGKTNKSKRLYGTVRNK